MFCTLPSSRSESRSGELASSAASWFSSQCSVYHNTCGVVAIFVAVERRREGRKEGRKAPLYEPRTHSQRGREHTGCRNGRTTDGRRTGRERALPPGFLVCVSADGRQATGELRDHSGFSKKPVSTLKSPVWCAARTPEMVRGGGREGEQGRLATCGWLVWFARSGSVGAATSVAPAPPDGRGGGKARPTVRRRRRRKQEGLSCRSPLPPPPPPPMVRLP